MPISIGSRYAIPQGSPWQVNQTWRERRRQMVDSFQNEASNASARFTTVWSNQISGSAELATKAAISRIQSAYAAKRAQALNQVKLA